MFRCTIYELPGDLTVLYFAVHHVAFDGASEGIFVRDLDLLYRGEELPLLAAQYRDYASWQRDWLAGPWPARQAQYWSAALQGAPAAVDLPFDYQVPATPSFAGAVMVEQLDAGLSNQVVAFAKATRSHVYSVLLAVYGELLGQHCSTSDVLVATPTCSITALRSDPTAVHPSLAGTEKLVGFFVNTMVSRVRRRNSVSCMHGAGCKFAA